MGLRFLELIEQDPERLAEMTHAEFATLGGFEGAEVIMWLVMRGALSPTIRKLHQSYYLPSMTGIATAIYEDDGPAAPIPMPGISRTSIISSPASSARGHLSVHAGAQRQGLSAEQVPARLIEPAWRATVPRRSGVALRRSAVSPPRNAHLVRDLDWRGMIHYGVSFFMLEKLGAVVGVSNLHIYAAMRGETLDGVPADAQRARKKKKKRGREGGGEEGEGERGKRAELSTFMQSAPPAGDWSPFHEVADGHGRRRPV